MTWRSGFRFLAIVTGTLLLAVTLLPATGFFRAETALPSAATPAAASATTGTANASAVGAAEGSADSERDTLDGVPREMRQQLADVARAYADNARFPDYATPLNANDWAQLHPRAFVARTSTLANMPDATASVLLDHYIVDRGNDLPVRVRVMSGSGPASGVAVSAVRVSLQRKGQGSTWLSLSAASDSDSSGAAQQTFAGVLPVSALRAVPEGDAAVVAELVFSGGQRSIVTAAVRLYDGVAQLVSVGSARVEGPDLVIPARFQVQGAGYYRVEANLIAERGNVPVSHLNAEFRLAAGNGDGVLKVHAVTLREKGEAGPYVLRDIDIRRMPDEPGEPVRYGTAMAETFAVRGFPLDAYSHEAWEDPAARQRLEFLQKLAGNPP